MKWVIFLLLAFIGEEKVALADEAQTPAQLAQVAGIGYHPEWYSEVWPTRPDQLQEFIDASIEPITDGSRSNEIQREGEWFFRRVNGLFRIPGGLRPQKALKLGLVKPEGISFLFSSKQDHVILRYYPNYCQSWAAYRASVDSPNDERTWQPVSVLATDQGRYQRSGTGSILIFWENGTIVVARGGIRLMTVPFESQPEEILFSGKTLLRELRWLEGVSVPPVDRESFFPDRWDQFAPSLFLTSTMVVNGSVPGSQKWEQWGRSSDVTVEWDEGGEITLAAEDGKERRYLAFPINVNGVCDIVFRVENATPGTGLFLADRERRPIGGLAFFRHTQSGKMIFGFHSAQDDNWERGVDPNQPLALTDGSQWFRVTIAAGTVRYWMSADGRIWSAVGPFSDQVDRRPAYCGLFITKGPNRRITLRDIYVYESMTPVRKELAELIAEIPDSIPTATDWDRWCELVIRYCPDTMPLREWRMACALRSISENPPSHLGQRILEQLWDDILTLDLPVTEKLAYSAFFARLISLSDWGIYERLTPRFRRLAWQLAVNDPEHSFSTTVDCLLRLPYWTQWRLPVFFTDLYRHQMFSALAKNDSEQLHELGLGVQWAAVPGSDVISDELRYLAALAVAHVQTSDPAARMATVHVRQPLVVTSSRAAYNFSREIEDAMANNNPEQVAQLILLAGREEIQSLYQDPLDPRRWSSFSLFLRNLLENQPKAKQFVIDKCQEVGRVQLRQAQSLGREDLAEDVFHRFLDTPISAEAALWLGDRSLVLGDLARARAYYSQIGDRASPELKSELLRRAEFCPNIDSPDQGQENRQPIDGLILAQDTPIADAAFQGQVDSLRNKNSTATLKPLLAAESPAIRRPQSMPDREFNWLKEQVAFWPSDTCLLMHAQADLRAYAWDGTLLWSQQATVSSDNAVRAMVQMHPLVHQDRIICRRLTQKGSELACLDLFDGHVIWAQRLGDHVVSDPWIQDDLLHVVVTTGSEFENYQLVLVCLDIRDGNIRQRSPLAVLSNVLDEPVECMIVPLKQRFLVQANGCLMLFDSLGRPLWSRTFPWLYPASSGWWHAQSWYAQRNPKPLIIGDQVFVSMRGGWFVASVELSTGKLQWYQPIGHLLGLFAYSNGKLYVETPGRMWVIAGTTGEKLGEYDWPARAEKVVLTEPRHVITFQVRSDERNRRQRSLFMQCIRLDDGEVLREMVVALADSEVEWVGPVMTFNGKLYVFFARPNNPQRFEVYELVLEPKIAGQPQVNHFGLSN